MFLCLYKAGATEEEGESIFALAELFSPRIENRVADVVVIDLEGCERVAGSPEEAARQLCYLTAEHGLKVDVAVASNPDAAIHAAKGFPGITVIAPTKESECLSGLSLEVLSPDLAGIDALRA